MENKSEVARILAQIVQEYEAGKSGLSGLAQGTSRHSFITTRMEKMGKLQNELVKLVGDQAIGLVATRLDQLVNNQTNKEQNVMSTEPLREHPSAYFVEDRANLEEIARASDPGQDAHHHNGGVLPELSDPSVLRRILYVGCGTGDWLMEMARSYPRIEKLFSADVSITMVWHERAKGNKKN